MPSSRLEVVVDGVKFGVEGVLEVGVELGKNNMNDKVLVGYAYLQSFISVVQ